MPDPAAYELGQYSELRCGDMKADSRHGCISVYAEGTWAVRRKAMLLRTRVGTPRTARRTTER